MSENPITPKSSILGRKVGGVPVLYIAAAIAVILVTLAWQTLRHKRAATNNTTGAPADSTANDGAYSDVPMVPALTYGSVTPFPAQGPTVDTGTNAAIKTNDQWFKAAEQYLIGQGYNAGDAQVALQHYLQGADLSYDQGVMRDAAVKEYGLPPTITDTGITAPKVTPEATAATVDAQREALTRRVFTEIIGRPATAVDVQWWVKHGPQSLDWPSWRAAGTSVYLAEHPGTLSQEQIAQF